MCSIKFKIGVIISLCLLSSAVKCQDSHGGHTMSSSGLKKARCATEPNASKKIEKVIKECENDLKIKLIRDTFLILQEEKINPHHVEQHYDDQDDHHIHNSYYLHHQHEEQPEIPDDDQTKTHTHIVYEPKPTYDHSYHYNHEEEHNHHHQYIPQHENYHAASATPAAPTHSPSANEHDDSKNKYWPYRDQPPSSTYGQSELNKKYWPYRAKRSPTTTIHHHHDDDDEIWKYNYELNENIHSTTIYPEDRWIAGCLIHCVLEKNNATDKHGWPTLDGLVAFYTDGVHEHEYFLHTLRFVDHCLKGASHRHGVHRYMVPERGQTCDLSFDIFDCVTDKITEYCSHK